MESIIYFLQFLSKNNIKLSVSGDSLHCYAPKGELTSEMKSGITLHKKKIIELLKDKKIKVGQLEVKEENGLKIQDDNGVRKDTQITNASTIFERIEFPLSIGQKGIFFIQLLNSEVGAYNVPLCLKFGPSIDISKLRQAWSHLLRRFPILRSRIQQREGEHFHIIERLDTVQADIALRTSAYTDVLTEIKIESKRPFKILEDYLCRATLFNDSNNAVYFLIVTHHIIFDGVSSVLIIHSLLDIYKNLLNSKPIAYENKFAYPNYVSWERQILGSQEGKELEIFWKGQLKGSQPILNLFQKSHSISSDSYKGETRVKSLSSELSILARSYSITNKVQLSALFLAVFQLLLHRYSREEKIYIGMPVMTRPREDFKLDVGYYVNMVPILSEVTKSVSGKDFILQAQSTVINALYHSAYPFPLMVEKFAAEKRSKNPVFQVSYAYQDFFQALPNLGSLADASIDVSLIESVVQQGDYDLTLEVYDTKDNFKFHVKFSPDLFTDHEVDRLTHHYISLLEEVIKNPDKIHSEYLVLSDEEKKLLQINSKGKESCGDEAYCLHHLFEDQVSRMPEQIALIYRQVQISYQELFDKSQILAVYLQYLGVQPDTLVGICIDRSPDMLVAILAILQSGGAYLPLDPEYPAERLSYMVSDSGIDVVLTQTLLSETIASVAPTAAHHLVIDRDWTEIVDCVANLKTNLQKKVGSKHLAYVIYTSGSTGLPKGVEVEHRNVVNHNRFAAKRYQISSEDRQIQFSNMGFDLFVEEVFVALSCGATLVLEKKEHLLNFDSLRELVELHKITVLNIPTAFFHAMVDADFVPANVNKIVVGGEKLNHHKAKQFLQQYPQIMLHNTYGPTETTIISAACIVNKIVLDQYKDIPIGRPITNTQVYILDQYQQLQPVGIPGELYIAGAGLARGYLNRPEFTEKKFVANPFDPGTRMYKTGDLARWLEDGNIEYLGRMDTQIKFRGFRIELGEIESRLNRYPEIIDSAVVVSGEADKQQLVAFYVAKDSTPDDLATLNQNILRQYLSENLPEYMLPVASVSLVSIPLTPNGKVDRRKLEQYDIAITSSQPYQASSTATEKQLVNLWAQLLTRNEDTIGIHDNFFELGGHSLLATQFMARLHQQVGVTLPLKHLFENPTIHQLADVLDASVTKQEPAPIAKITPVDRSQLASLPLSFSQERLWFMHQLDPENGAYNIPGAILVHSYFSIPQLEKAFNELITRHESLRSVFPSGDGVVQQVVLMDFTFHIDTKDISEEPDAAARNAQTQVLCEAESTRVFDLATGPLIRCLVIKRQFNEHVILLNMHHIISDGWSLDILIDELSEILAAYQAGREARLAPLPVQYVDYCVWQREHLRDSAEFDKQLNYWKNKLAGISESLALSTDFLRPKEQCFDGAAQAFHLDATLTEALKDFSNTQGCTLYMTLLAVTNVLLYRYTGQSDICIGSPIANRQQAEIENIIGMFVNTLVLRNQVSGEQSFTGLLQQVKKGCLAAYEHQDIPFEKLVEVIQPQRNLAINPLFQVMFALQTSFKRLGPSNDQERSAQPYVLPHKRSKFDLTIDIEEGDCGLSGVIIYSTALFREASIQRLACHIETLCQSILADANKKIGELNILPEQEMQSLFNYCTSKQNYLPEDKCVHQLFVAQVKKTPDNIAIVHNDDRLSYSELYNKSYELALYLQSLGCGPDTIVGLCLESSLEMMVGIWGVLLAGGAYVLFDSNNPDERLEYVFHDSQVNVVLTSSSTKKQVGSIIKGPKSVIALEESWPHIQARARSLMSRGEEIKNTVTPDNLVYLVYTSGSTGNPKGATNIHRGFSNLIQWYIKELNMMSSDRILVMSNTSFDLTQKT